MSRDVTSDARWRKRAALFAVVLGLVSSSLAAGANDADRHSRAPKHATGVVKYPCVNPSLTRNGTTPNGVCGYQFAVNGGASYTVRPLKPADIDIHFVNGAGEFVLQQAGSPTECGRLSGTVHQDAVKAIVVTSPSACFTMPGGSHEGSTTGVSFVYDE